MGDGFIVTVAAILREMGVPCLVHQPRYNMFDRWVEDGLLQVLKDEGVGVYLSVHWPKVF